jgi:hypothetical protein
MDLLIVTDSVRGIDLSEIYSGNVVAKIVQVAERGYRQKVSSQPVCFRVAEADSTWAPLSSYPHTVPQNGTIVGNYEEREADFWTCGFFPGSIYAIIERTMRFPQALDIPKHVLPHLQAEMLKLGRHYGLAIEEMSKRTDTHDMGFIVQPALQKDWELTANGSSRQSVINAAYALASRYDAQVKAIRSWDVAINNRYSITDMSTNFLVIIDSMCSKFCTLHRYHVLTILRS